MTQMAAPAASPWESGRLMRRNGRFQLCDDAPATLNPWGRNKRPCLFIGPIDPSLSRPKGRSGDACRSAAAAFFGRVENLDDLIEELPRADGLCEVGVTARGM